MVTWDEERKGLDTEAPSPAASHLRPLEESTPQPVETPSEGRPQTQPERRLSRVDAGFVDEAVVDEWPAPVEDVANPLFPTKPTDQSARATVSAPQAPNPPPLPEGVGVGATDADEDEATGRRVESLLAEAPDGYPESALPARGEEAPAFEMPSPFKDFDFDAGSGSAHEEPATSAGTPPNLSIVDASSQPSAAAPYRPLRGRGMDRVGPIVAFDFDGTLTVRDSFTAFLKWREGSGRYHAEMAALAPAALKYLFDRDPGKLKTAAIRRFLAGLPRSVLNQEAMEFATISAPMLFRPDALKVWRRYRQDGARLLIVTASPENIVAPFARGLGADMLIGTQLLFDPEDRVQGGLLGDNCRGPEKVNRIRAALGDDVVLAAAYGDTDGDWEMLEMADQQFMRLFVGVPGKSPGAG